MSEENPPGMGTWNNRIFLHKEEFGNWYGIHETHYGDDGKPVGWTVNAQEPFGETVDELISSLKRMLADAERFKDSVLDYDSEPEVKGVYEEDLIKVKSLEGMLASGKISADEFSKFTERWDLEHTPNAETIAAMEAVEHGEVKSADTVEELMEELNKDDE